MIIFMFYLYIFFSRGEHDNSGLLLSESEKGLEDGRKIYVWWWGGHLASILNQEENDFLHAEQQKR